MKKQVVFIAGHNGMVGSAVLRKLSTDNTLEIVIKDRNELDLCNQAAVNDFFSNKSINQVYLCAAKVGGIFANQTYPVEFIYENLQIQNNVIYAAHLNNVNKLLFLGSSCIYPKFTTQPICEEALLTDKLEPTNEFYAIAKIAGLKLCEAINKQFSRDYRCLMPTNLYGTGDNYHSQNSHVVPALIRKFYEGTKNKSSEVVLWGTGTPKREFLHVDDLANAAIHVMNLPMNDWTNITSPGQGFINVGTGRDISILELAQLIARVFSYQGNIRFDPNMPDGTPRKLLNVDKIKSTKWEPKIDIEIGIRNTIKEFVNMQQ